MPAPFFDDAAKMWDLGPVLLRTPQACFEYSRGEIIGLPSRLSAPPDAQISRQKALDDVARDGITFGYRRLRVGKSGRQFSRIARSGSHSPRMEPWWARPRPFRCPLAG